MEKLNNYKEQIDKIVSDKNKPWSQAFDVIHQKTGLDKSYIFLGDYSFFSSILHLEILCSVGYFQNSCKHF